MGSIQFRNQCTPTVTCVPNIFIDQFMPEANGEYIKVYLYLLRCIDSSSGDISISAIADCFDHTEKDVIRALKYWERMKLIHLDYASDKSISGITLLPMCTISEGSVTELSAEDTSRTAPSRGRKSAAAAQTSAKQASAEQTVVEQTAAEQTTTRLAEAPAPIPASDAAKLSAPAKKTYSLNEVQGFCSDPDVTELFFIIETYLKRPLSASDTNMVLYWYDELKLSSELIIYLVEYCISEGHSSFHYMDKVALHYHEAHITTIEQAKENSAEHSKVYYAVMKALGITGRKLVDSENALIRKWTRDFGFALPIIEEACRRTIASTGQPSFKYLDGILCSWHKNQVHTLEDVKKIDADFARTRKTTASAAGSSSAAATRRAGNNKFNNFNQREYDMDQLERMLLTTNVQ